MCEWFHLYGVVVYCQDDYSGSVLVCMIGIETYFDDISTCVFFFKQKTAYEMLRSLVGSEMCIRDSL